MKDIINEFQSNLPPSARWSAETIFFRSLRYLENFSVTLKKIGFSQKLPGMLILTEFTIINLNMLSSF